MPTPRQFQPFKTDMPAPAPRPKVFVSYSHKDREVKEKLDDNLHVLREQGVIDFWTDGEILPGDHWPDEITEALNSSQLILFLVSNHFLASSFIRRKEAPMAMQRVNRGEAMIVPIILTKTPGWQKEEWNTFQALPSQVKPIDHPDWRKPENAFADVEEKLRELIEVLPQKLAKQAAQWKKATTGRTEEPTKPQPTDDPPPETTSQEPKTNNAWIKWAALAAVLTMGIFIGIWAGHKPPADDQDISPELQAWLKAPKVDRTVVEVFSGKGNGDLHNGLQPLVTNHEIVAGQRIHELNWENQGKPTRASNGLTWNFVVKGVAAPVITKPVEMITYFNAVKSNSDNAASKGIQVDPNDSTAYKPCVNGEGPPGFTYSNASTGATPSMLWNEPCYSPNFFAGTNGNIPEGLHRVAFEVRIENKPVYRGLMNLKVPPRIYAQPLKTWVNSLPKTGIDVSLVEKSVCWPSESELSWKVQMKGSPAPIPAPLTFRTYYKASETHSDAPQEWLVDPYHDGRVGKAIEIEGFNHWEFSWAWGEESQGKWSANEAVQTLSLHCGPGGEFLGGKHEIALEVLSKGEPVWRGPLTLDVPEQAWSFPEEKNKLVITDDKSKGDIRNGTLPTNLSPSFNEGNRSVVTGLTFGQWKIRNKGEQLEGPFFMHFYLKATRAPEPADGAITTFSVATDPGISTFLDKPDSGGFTTMTTGALDPALGVQNAVLPVAPSFYVGLPNGQHGKILPGIHEVGIEILNDKGAVFYRGITTLELK